MIRQPHNYFTVIHLFSYLCKLTRLSSIHEGNYMNYKAIIFDMDGTIIETEHIWQYARNFLVTSRGIPLTPELEQELGQRCAGRSMRDCCAIIKELANIPDSI